MCAVPQNVAHCQQRAMAARRKNNRNVRRRVKKNRMAMGKNTSRPYHCTFHCWCNNYAKANNIWQTFKNASSQNVHTDTLPCWPRNPPPKTNPFDQTETRPKLCFPATNVFDNMQQCNKLTINEVFQHNQPNMHTFVRIPAVVCANTNIYVYCVFFAGTYTHNCFVYCGVGQKVRGRKLAHRPPFSLSVSP